MEPVLLDTEEPSLATVGRNHLHQICSYPDEIWDSMKSMIKSFYMDEGYSLPQLMRKFATEYDFHATVKMYKLRFTRWGFEKNVTKSRLDHAHSLPKQRLAKYLRRKGLKNHPLATTGLPTPTTETPSIDHQTSNYISSASIYEGRCPYRLFDKKFRFVEEFPDGMVYQGDSFGYRSYIDLDDERPCSSGCSCRTHEPVSTSGYAFVVHKSIHHITVKIQSDSLLAEIGNCTCLKALSTSEDPRLLDGFMLLRHHAILKKHLLQFVCVPVQDVLFELRLLVDGLLGDGQVFRSFGYERLHEHGHLDFELWRAFQQQKLDSDIDDISRAVEDDELISPPIQNNTSQGLGLELDDRSFGTVAKCDSAGYPYGSDLVQEYSPYITITSTYQVEDEFIPKNSGEEEILRPHSNADIGQRMADDESPGNLQMPQSLLRRIADSEATVSLEKIVQAGHKTGVQAFLNAGAVIDISYALESASGSGNPGLVQMVLDAGADVNKYHTLLNAIESGFPEIVQMLINAGANVNKYHTILSAIESGNPEMVQMLLDAGAEVNHDNNLPDAVKLGNPAIVQMLLSAGADVDRHGSYILSSAIESGNPGIVQMLINAGADVKRHLSYMLWNAVESGNLEIVQILLDAGADVNKQCALVLESASRSGRPEIVRMLLDAGAQASLHGSFALESASRLNNPEIVQMLLTAGVDVNGSNSLVFAKATESGNPEIVQMFLDAGADVNNNASYALTNAIQSGNPEIVQMLVGILNYEQENLFLVAAASGDTPEMKRLLDHGVDVNAYGKLGTALNIAVLLGNADGARCLLEHGADIQLATLHAYTRGTYTIRDFLKRVERVQNKSTVRRRDKSLQQLRHNFFQQYQPLLDTGRLSHTKLYTSRVWFQNYRHAWNIGIGMMRRLSRGKVPSCLRDILTFLILARAITKTLQISKKWDYTNNFNRDLPRWEILLDNSSDLEAYRDAIWRMWAVDLTQMLHLDKPCPEAIHSFDELARILASRMQDMLDVDLSDGNRLDQSQRKWRESNGQQPPQEQESPIRPSHSCSASQSWTPRRPPGFDGPRIEPREQKPPSPSATCLLKGAIFVIIIIFFQALSRRVSSPTLTVPFRRINTLEERRAILSGYLGIRDPQLLASRQFLRI